MNLGWYDSKAIPFNALLLLERCQIGWFCSRDDVSAEAAVAFNANPHVMWYFQHKNPAVKPWIQKVREACPKELHSLDVRKAEVAVLESAQDWIAYVWDPGLYEKLPFISEDSSELLSTVDFSDKWVLDVGAGTGRLSFQVAPVCRVLYASEPVGNLRDYMRDLAFRKNLRNVYVVDGLIEELPFPDHTFDIAMGGYVFGDNMPKELGELRRVTKIGGSMVLCPGNVDKDNETHAFLTAECFSWKRYEESKGIMVRKYWASKGSG